MGLLALACLVVVILLLPNEVLYGIFYLGLIALVGMVGALAFVMWLAESA